MPQLRHLDGLGTARFVTFSCYHRYQLLTDSRDVRSFLGLLHELTRKHRIGMLGYVVMPEHVHLVLDPPDNVQVGLFVGELKSRSARAILARWRIDSPRRMQRLMHADGGYRFWQARCYDHNCRTPETVLEKITYCHKNPVNRGLVRDSADWPWSSCCWYRGLDDVEIEIDGFS